MSTQDKLADALRKLLDYADSLTCRHEQTHRGGSIWTICDDCGEEWADDRGGFIPYADAVAVAQARAAIAALRQPVPDAVREDVLIRQLRGRAAFLRNRGRVKSPALMEEAASCLESALASQQESRNAD